MDAYQHCCLVDGIGCLWPRQQDTFNVIEVQVLEPPSHYPVAKPGDACTSLFGWVYVNICVCRNSISAPQEFDPISRAKGFGLGF
jgi:hypothetical protein